MRVDMKNRNAKMAGIHLKRAALSFSPKEKIGLPQKKIVLRMEDTWLRFTHSKNSNSFIL